MKTLQTNLKVLAALTIMLWSCQSEAQRPKLKNASAEQIAEVQTKKQSDHLQLSTEKTEQLKAINLKYAQELKKMREEGRLSENQQKLKELNEAQNNEVRQILSPEKFEQYQSLKKQQFQRLRKNRQQNAERMKEKQEARIERLELNDDQLEKMKSIRTKYAEEKKQLRDERTRETMQKLKALNDEQNKEVKAILSEEQYQEYLKMVEENRARFKERRQKQFRDRKN
jgi:hypothetical protein